MGKNQDQYEDGWQPLEFGSNCIFFKDGAQVLPGNLRHLDIFTVDNSNGEYKVLKKKMENKKLVILAERFPDKGFMRIQDLQTGEIYRAEAICNKGNTPSEYLITHRGQQRWLSVEDAMYA